MPDCDYCEDTFDSEDAYLAHLEREHEGELSRIDQRRVDGGDDGDSDIPVGMLVIAGVVVLTIGLVGFVVAQSISQGPTDPQHSHGTMEIVIQGEELPLTTDPQFTAQGSRFHFHPNQGRINGEHVWHTHAQGVGLQEALQTLGIEVNDNGTRLTYDGTTYDESNAGTDIRITVDGEPVDPGEYTLVGVGPVEGGAAQGEGDNVRVVVEAES